MNDLIGNNYEPTQEQLKAKKMMKIVGAILILLLIIAIALIALMYYIKLTQLKITINGQSNTKLQNILLFEGDKIYVPIREFATYVGYESYSGDYKQYAEDDTKCYVKCANEITSFTMNSDKIYKLLTNGNDYEYFTINEPVKMINGVLYTTIESAQRAFNISFSYDKAKNQITIYTLPYLVTNWSAQFANSAIAGNDAMNFSNQKALLYNMIVVKNADNFYGVYDLNGKEILGTKYASIQFIESTREFIVTTAENKMGIMSYDATTKIRPEYDQIKQIDKDAGLYLVTNNGKQGVINNNGNSIVYMEYDQIGIDASQYNSNNIKNQYLLYDNCIPVKLNNKWGIFDKTGRKILPVEYEELGCRVGAGSSGHQNANNILLIPEYEGIVVKKGGLYGVLDSKGEQLIPIALKSVYSTTSAGEETYYMVYQNQIMNVLDYIKIVKNASSNNANQNNVNQNTINQNNTNQNTVNQNTTTKPNNTTNQNNTATANTVSSGQVTNTQQGSTTIPANANTVPNQ